MSFNDIVTAGQSFAEQSGVFGEAFTFQGTQLIGVFNQVELDYRFEEFATRKETALICVTSKAQWVTAGLVPSDRDSITYGGITYQIQKIDGSNTSAEPAYTLTLFKQT